MLRFSVLHWGFSLPSLCLYTNVYGPRRETKLGGSLRREVFRSACILFYSLLAASMPASQEPQTTIYLFFFLELTLPPRRTSHSSNELFPQRERKAVTKERDISGGCVGLYHSGDEFRRLLLVGPPQVCSSTFFFLFRLKVCESITNLEPSLVLVYFVGFELF